MAFVVGLRYLHWACDPSQRSASDALSCSFLPLWKGVIGMESQARAMMPLGCSAECDCKENFKDLMRYSTHLKKTKKKALYFLFLNCLEGVCIRSESCVAGSARSCTGLQKAIHLAGSRALTRTELNSVCLSTAAQADYCFYAIYLMELTLRFSVYGVLVLKSHWRLGFPGTTLPTF